MENKWCYGVNGENFTGDCSTREIAIEEAIGDYGDEDKAIYIGQAVAPAIYVSACRIIDEIYENVAEECGEYADGFLDAVSKEAQDALQERINAVLKAWLKEFGYEPSFYSVINIEKIDINEYSKDQRTE
ncbi:hypothetical protein P4K96_29105 [Bacillus cereus]|uniref:hypothetical protein n=1 Tax=Paenibacillus melissococcoides TaxID=2912268 RepID=UPI002DD2DCD4|nr:hypothetical protein [Bacillus cereus]